MQYILPQLWNGKTAWEKASPCALSIGSFGKPAATPASNAFRRHWRRIVRDEPDKGSENRIVARS